MYPNGYIVLGKVLCMQQIPTFVGIVFSRLLVMNPQIVRTLGLSEAADFLKMTREGLRRKAARGDIPGGKPGKRWCFREDDLAAYLRSLYPVPSKLSVTTSQPAINGDSSVTFPLYVTS